MHILFLFLDGVGLGENDLEHNPLAAAQMPNLYNLLGGRRLLRSSPPLETGRASLLSLDPNMNVGGLPQSATGQAALITGKNIPEMIGQHYGPKPNQEVREILAQSNLFCTLKENGYQAALLNAYPDRYFEAIDSGKRLYSAIPQAVVNAEIPLKTKEDLYAGQALSVDFTGEGWRTFLNDTKVPLLATHQAGEQLAGLARSLDFSFFEYWPSDYAGHRSKMEDAGKLLENFDAVLGGLLANWDMEKDVIFLTSDHGNLEDIRTRKHTHNPVPGLVIGPKFLRDRIAHQLVDLTGIAPAILQLYE